MKNVSLFILLGGFLFVGCHDELKVLEKIDNYVIDQFDRSICVDNGILVFNDRESFGEVLGQIFQMSMSDYLEWVETVGFESQYYALSKILEADEKYDKYLY